MIYSTDVHFKAAGDTTDYGLIHIPQGTRVERIRDNDNDPWSDWFVVYPETVCPEKYYFDGKPGEMFMHDATHYGIRVHSFNVFSQEQLANAIREKVAANKKTTTFLKIVAIKFYRELTGSGLADAKEWVESNPATYQV